MEKMKTLFNKIRITIIITICHKIISHSTHITIIIHIPHSMPILTMPRIIIKTHLSLQTIIKISTIKILFAHLITFEHHHLYLQTPTQTSIIKILFISLTFIEHPAIIRFIKFILNKFCRQFQPIM